MRSDPQTLAESFRLTEWWTAIAPDVDPKWQELSFTGLAVAYGVLALVALLQLLRIQWRVPEYGWTTQKVFHLLNCVVGVLRAAVFALRHKLDSIHEVAVRLALLDFPGLLFFTTYTLLVLFWAEIYHQARSLPTGSLRPIFAGCNILVYLCQMGLLMFYGLAPDAKTQHVAKLLSSLFMALVSIAACAGFLLYGGRLFLMLKRFPIESRGRKKKLREVGFVTTICSLCFAIRAGLILFAAFDEKEADLDMWNHPVLNVLYYTLCEIVPAALVLFILRKLPPKRNAQGYQPVASGQ